MRRGTLGDNIVLSDRIGHETERGYKYCDNSITMDFCQAGARQGGDEAEAGGEGEGLEGIILYHLTGWGTGQKGDINPVTTP
jgi:hypothetical protein